MNLKILIFLWTAQVLALKAQKSKISEREIVRTLLDNSDPDQRPTSDGSSAFTESGAINVEVNLYVRALGPINTRDMEMETDITLRQKWLDPRLKYAGRDVEYVTLEDDERLWKPDTFIRNEKEPSSLFLVPSKASYLRVYPDGFVLYSVRIKSKLHCLMDLRNYPFDKQECKINLASYAFNKDDLVYVWKEDGPLTVHTVLPQTGFQLTGQTTKSVAITTSTATYSTLEVGLTISRIGSFCVLTQFVPLAMLVITALISLWIPTDPAVKIGLNALLLMSVSFKAEHINNGLPFTNYTKAIDTWSGWCVLFIFISFILAAFCPVPVPEDEDKGCSLAGFRSWSFSGKVSFIARVSLIGCYLLFNIFYWGYYGATE